ncbi:MAG: FecR domain-containing protein [Parasphingorhabdus sp.]
MLIQSLPLNAALLAPILLFFAMTPADSAPVQVGIAATVVGDVRRSNATITKAVKIPRRQRLAWGDMLSTRKKSKLQILLLDRSTLTIGSNAQLAINRFVYDPGKERSFGATVSKGAFRFMSGRKSAKSSATVDSSVGTIGIRGTAIDGVVGKDAVKIASKEPFLDGVKGDKDSAMLVVLRGPGPDRSGDLDIGLAEVSAAGKTVTLDQPILAAYIPRPGAQPIGPFQLSASGLSKLQDLLAPSVTNANKSGVLGKLLPAAVIGVGIGLLLPRGKDECVDQNTAGACQ